MAKRASIILWRAEGLALSEIARRLAVGRRTVRKWLKRFLNQRMAGRAHTPGMGRQSVFSPEVAVHLVTMACGRADLRGRSLPQWDCLELAYQLQREGFAESIPAQSWLTWCQQPLGIGHLLVWSCT